MRKRRGTHLLTCCSESQLEEPETPSVASEVAGVFRRSRHLEHSRLFDEGFLRTTGQLSLEGGNTHTHTHRDLNSHIRASTHTESWTLLEMDSCRGKHTHTHTHTHTERV